MVDKDEEHLDEEALDRIFTELDYFHNALNFVLSESYNPQEYEEISSVRNKVVVTLA